MTDADEKLRLGRGDRWTIHRIWVVSGLGIWMAGAGCALDFWPLGGPAQTLRTIVDLSRLILVILGIGILVGLLIAASVSCLRRRFRRAASNIIAILTAFLGFMIVKNVALFDPWLWYVLVNKAHFESIVANDASINRDYAVLVETDVSTGLAGIDPNHFVFLVFDGTDDISLDPSDRPAIWQSRYISGFTAPLPKGRRLYGHFFRVDYFD
jgi:hypothetical protein